jgi:hypothetical protein
MSLWRGILQQRRDEWTSSLRGLDGIEAKPEIYNENIPAFRHNGTSLVVRNELRSDEAFLRDFTPFDNKKGIEYLNKMRASEWLDANMPDTSLFGDTAIKAYVAQDDVTTELPPSPPSEPDYYEGQAEDEEFFAEFQDEIMDNPFQPGTAEYKMIERRNDIVRGRGIEAYTYKERQMERLSVAFSSAETVREKQEAYDNFLAAWVAGGNSEQSFINMWGMRPEETVMSGGGGAEAEQARIDAERNRAAMEDMIEEWKYAINPATGNQFTKSELKEYIKTTLGKSRNIGLSGINSYRALFKYMIENGITPPT